MKYFLGAIAVVFFVQPAFAFHCPADMAAIDAALAANPQISTEQLAQVKALRAEGETLHKAGDHANSVATLATAMDILGLN